MRRWRDGDAVYVGIGGTGSISCVAITEGDAAEAASRRAPFGFRAESRELPSVVETQERARPRLAVDPDWGEALWTAPDLR